MPSINKIKKRDLDESLVLEINSKLSIITEDDLSPELRKKISSGGSGSGGSSYDDTNLRNRTIVLEKNKVDKSELNNYFNKNTDKVNLSMLDSNLRPVFDSSLSAMLEMLNAYRRKNDKIQESDLSTTVQAKLNDKGNSGPTDLSPIVQHLSSVDDKIATNTFNIETVTKNVSKLTSDIDSKINGSKQEILENNSILKQLVENARQKNVSIKKDDLDFELNSIISRSVQKSEDAFAAASGAKLFVNNLPGQIVFIEGQDGAAGAKNLLVNGAFVLTDTELNNAKARSEKTIYDLKNNVLLIYDEGAYKEQASIMSYFSINGGLVFDERLQRLCYIYNDKYTVLSQNQHRETVATTIPGNGSYRIDVQQIFGNRKQAIDIVARVLVKDNDSSSRTLNKYINSEAVATISYSDSLITIYNDADTALDFAITLTGDKI
jgi:hypothetical protein